MPTTRKIVLCADDAGWDEASDDVIWRHARAGEISAVSLLVDGPEAGSWAKRDPGTSCSLGLHFNLTWSPCEGSKGLGKLLVAAFAGRVSRSWITERACEQLAQFESLCSRPPDFIDGHQHVHILPGVREPLLQILQERYGTRQTAIRVPYSRQHRGAKAAILNGIGARRLQTELRARRWPANKDFAGTYNLSTDHEYRHRMRSWLESIETGGLIMAHPGSERSAEHPAARVMESAYFAGPDWKQDLSEANVSLIPFTTAALAALE